MSDFLVIVPPGWTELNWEFISNNVANMSAQAVNNGVISEIEQWLKDGNIIRETDTLLDYKLLDNTYFLIKLSE